MIVFKAIFSGWRKLRKNLWLAGLIYLANFVFFLLVALPLWVALNEAIGGTRLAVEPSLALDPNILLPAVLPHISLFKVAIFSPFVLFAGLLFILLNIFFAGGAIFLFVKEEKSKFSRFFLGGGLYFFRFLRLFLISMIFIGLVLLLNSGGGRLLSGVFGDSPNEPLIFYTKFLFSLVILLIFLFVDMTFDYAKIGMVTKDGKKAFSSTLSAFSFSFRNFGAVFSLYLLLFLLGSAATYGVSLLRARLIPQAFPVTLFLIYQAYFLFRVALTLVFYSSESSLYLMRGK
jgi:hypothetical protein